MPAIRALTGPAGVVALVTTLVYGFIFIRDLLLASQFGRSVALDSLLIALIIPNYLVSAVGGSLSTAIVPFYLATSRSSESMRLKFIARITYVALSYCAICVCVVILLLVLAGPTLTAMGLASNLSPWLVGLLVFGVLSNVFTAIGNVDRRLAISASAPAIAPTIVCLVVVIRGRACTIEDVAIATLLGGILQCVLQILPHWKAFLHFEKAQVILDWKKHSRLDAAVFPLLFGAIIMSTMTAIDQVFASSFGPGAVATVSFAGKFPFMFLAVLTVAVSAVALPELSRHAADRAWTMHRETVAQLGMYSFFVFSLIAAGIFLYSNTITYLLFQRGEFTAVDTAAVAELQRWYALQLPFYAAGLIFSRAHASFGDTKTLFAGNVLAVLVKITMAIALAPFIGLIAIAISTVITYASCLAFLWITYGISLRKLASRVSKLPNSN